MLRLAKLFAFILVASLFYVAPAHAQATRTWVSGVGDDVNPCSRTAPCKTFAGAISKTATGGEIDCLDPGGFGTLTVTKAITIDCTGTFGSVLASGTIGFNVNAGTGNVILRGISINGAGTTNGTTGINFISGNSLTVENVVIQNFTTGNAAGIRFAPGAPAQLFVHNAVIANNGTAGAGGGILIAPAAGSTGSARVTVEDVQMDNNANGGFRIDTTGNTNATGVVASIDNSSISGSVAGVTAFQPVGAAPATIMVRNSTIANNTTVGLLASGANARIRVGGSTITNNSTAAIQGGGGIVNTYGNNQVNGNATSDGTFTLPAIPLT